MAKRKTDLFEGGGVFRFAFWLVILKFSLLVSFRFVVCAAVSLVWSVMLVCLLIIMLSVGKVYLFAGFLFILCEVNNSLLSNVCKLLLSLFR